MANRLEQQAAAAEGRSLQLQEVKGDLCVVGGGLAGFCAALAAAREGLQVILVHDRPVLGGNSSSEVRLWVLGATSHMISNNRWAREGGLVGELLEENMWRNPEGNPLLWDLLLLEKAREERKLSLLLNTACLGCELKGAGDIGRVIAHCSQNETRYHIEAPLFVDSSGDGVLAFAAGAPFRMGAEDAQEFQEAFAPDEEFGGLLGQSIYFYSKDVGTPVPFVAPDFALQDITEIPRWRRFNAKTQGCSLWWIEYGGRLDPVHDTEEVKWELWKVAYGVWHHIKNSGMFPEAENLTLEWVGMVPGKRESRRFEGLQTLVQSDVMGRTLFDNAVAHGGWSIDLHPADGVYAEREGSHHLYAKGIYSIPLGCYLPKQMENLMVAGRIISASHVAFGSTRVMGTCALGGEALGVLAAIATEQGRLPKDLYEDADAVRCLQERLMRIGHWVPGQALQQAEDLIQSARCFASSEFDLAELPADGPWVELGEGYAQMLPLMPGAIPAFSLELRCAEATELQISIRLAERADEYTPEELLWERTLSLSSDEQKLGPIPVEAEMPHAAYAFLVLQGEGVELRGSNLRCTGLLSLRKKGMFCSADVGGYDIENWMPPRRPLGHLVALQLDPAPEPFAASQVANGLQRPTSGPNAWVADPADPAPRLRAVWSEPQQISRVELQFDADWDHAMESVQYRHADRAMPYRPSIWHLEDDQGRELYREEGGVCSRVVVELAEAVLSRELHLVFDETRGAPASLFCLRAYA